MGDPLDIMAMLASLPPSASAPAPTVSPLAMAAEILGPWRKGSKMRDLLDAQGVQRTSELERILALPRRDPDEPVDLTAKYILPRSTCMGCDLCRDHEPRLRPIQSRILLEAQQQGGVFAGAGVGSGKTLAALLLCEALGGKRTVLLVDSSLKEQMLGDARRYGQHFRILYNQIFIVTYPELSSAAKNTILFDIDPEIIVADECHVLAKPSTRSIRFWEFVKDRPGAMHAHLTGTPFRKSMKNYAKLMELCLGARSPVPRPGPALNDWAAALDDSVTGEPMPPGALMLLCEDGEDVRDGFRRRLCETPGVIITQEDEGVDCELVIRKLEVPRPPVIEKALSTLETYAAWDGEELDSAMAMGRVRRQLVLGFFYRWDWDKIGGKNEEWLEARNAWAREVREMLAYRPQPGMDSPLLLRRAAQSGRWNSQTYAAWAALEHLPEPPVIPIWMDESVAATAAAWAKEGPGIVWSSYPEFGQRVAHLAGIEYVGAGRSKDLFRMAHSANAGTYAMILSADAYTKGQNLQAWNRALFTSCPSAGLDWQQRLGREHRPGQKAKEVVVDLFWGPETYPWWVSARTDAKTAEETLGQKQKMLAAKLANLPL